MSSELWYLSCFFASRQHDQQQTGSVPAEMWLVAATVYVTYSADWNVYIECFSSLKITMVMVPKTKALAFCHG